MKLILGTYTTT